MDSPYRHALGAGFLASILFLCPNVSAENVVFWTNNEGQIHAFDTAGGGETVFPSPAAADLLNADESLQQIFVTYWRDQLVRRFHRDGTPVGEDLGVPGVRNVKVSRERQEVYFSSLTEPNNINVFPLPEGAIDTILSISPIIFLEPDLDPDTGLLFATGGSVELNTVGILTWSLETNTHLDGIDDCTPVDENPVPCIVSFSKSIEVDPRQAHLFYGYNLDTTTNPPAGDFVHRIERCDYNFENREVIWNSGNPIVDALAVDGNERKLYFAEADPTMGDFVFMRIDLDGSDPEVLFRTDRLPRSIDTLIPLPTPASTAAAIEAQYTQLAVDIDLLDDYDGDGLPESLVLEMIRRISEAHTENPSELGAVTASAFQQNFRAFDNEMISDEFADFREGISALMLQSRASQGVLQSILASRAGETLIGVYQAVTCAGGVVDCQTVTGPGTRNADAVFSGQGDPDRDGMTNAEEWAEVMMNGGSQDEFLDAVFGDLLVTPDSSGGGGGGGCFIATAAYGTPLANELQALRVFRDRQLLSSRVGALFVDAYYRVSPPIAQSMSRSKVLRTIVRPPLSLVTHHPGSILAFGSIVILGIALLIFRTTVSFRIPRRGSHPRP